MAGLMGVVIHASPQAREKTLARYQSYVICTSPRSGSTLLCKLLTATGIAGRPGSHFHDPSLSGWLKDYGLSPDSYASAREALKAVFGAAHARGTGTTGMFGLRLQRRSFEFFMQQMDNLHPGLPDDLARFQAAFGSTLFIHLTRANKLAQAISYVKASQTGLWHQSPDGTELERLSAPKDPVYDAEAIAGHMAEMATWDREWNDWFARARITPVRLSYDALSADPSRTLAKILDTLGLATGSAQSIVPAVAKLADATSRDWAKRFAEENTSQRP